MCQYSAELLDLSLPKFKEEVSHNSIYNGTDFQEIRFIVHQPELDSGNLLRFYIDKIPKDDEEAFQEVKTLLGYYDHPVLIIELI